MVLVAALEYVGGVIHLLARSIDGAVVHKIGCLVPWVFALANVAGNLSASGFASQIIAKESLKFIWKIPRAKKCGYHAPLGLLDVFYDRQFPFVSRERRTSSTASSLLRYTKTKTYIQRTGLE